MVAAYQPPAPDNEPSPPPPTGARLGMLWIPADWFREGNWSQFLGVLSPFLPVRVEHIFAEDRFEWVAFSPLFDPVTPGEVIPTYRLNVVTAADDSGAYTLAVVRLKPGDMYTRSTWRKSTTLKTDD